MTSLSFLENRVSSFQSGETFLRSVLENILKAYLERNPVAKTVWELVRTAGNEGFVYDHFTFRTLAGIIKKCLKASDCGHKHAILSSVLGSLIWEKPSSTEFNLVAKENEYAAWTLVHGYILNHVAISVHQMKNHLNDIERLRQFLEENGFKPNTEGGVIKVSPDGLLRQISSMAEAIPLEFADGSTELFPCSYIEFTERLVVPRFKDVPDNEIEESHRRDGFEFESANIIFCI